MKKRAVMYIITIIKESRYLGSIPEQVIYILQQWWTPSILCPPQLELIIISAVMYICIDLLQWTKK